jgi:hypothetical protein
VRREDPRRRDGHPGGGTGHRRGDHRLSRQLRKHDGLGHARRAVLRECRLNPRWRSEGYGGLFIGIIEVSGATGPPAVFQARAVVFYCANQLCTAGMQLHRRDLGPVKRGETARLRVQWDRDNHRFIFQRDDASEVFAPYAVSDTDPPASAAKWLDAMYIVPNCTATPRPMAFIGAWFDDVMVSESVAPRAER